MGWNFAQNGTASQPITFNAQPGATIVSRNQETADGIDLEGSSYVIINGFTVTNADGSITRAGIRSVINTNAVIEHNNVSNCGTWGIFTGFSQNVVIKNNVTSKSQTQHGIYVSNSADNPVIQGNIVFANHDCGIQINADASQGGDGIITNALIANNMIYNNGTGGGSAINLDGVQDSVIVNNLLFNNHASGISLYQIDGAGPSLNNLIVNNTIVNASNSRWALNIQNASTGNTVYNNILYDANPSHGSIDISTDSLPGFKSDYNIVVNRFTTNDGNTVQTLAQWQQATGQDKHSKIATTSQLFVSIAKNNYHEAPGSPSIDAGTSQDAPKVDISGHGRPSGKGYDIGCYELEVTPTVIAEQPAANATGVSVTTVVTATFNEPVQPGTIIFTLQDSVGHRVAATQTYDSSTDTVKLTPSAALAYGTTYTATVSGAKDLAGNPMTGPFTWKFTTAAGPDFSLGNHVLLAASGTSGFSPTTFGSLPSSVSSPIPMLTRASHRPRWSWAGRWHIGSAGLRVISHSSARGRELVYQK
jgi:parallel beta-helix repeat protein